jgi:hypothetical protein
MRSASSVATTALRVPPETPVVRATPDRLNSVEPNARRFPPIRRAPTSGIEGDVQDFNAAMRHPALGSMHRGLEEFEEEKL